MSLWLGAAVLAGATLVMRAAGPLYLGTRRIDPRLESVLKLLAPPLLAALVITQTFFSGNHLVFDARIVGLLAAVLAIGLRAPLPLIVVAGAAGTALARAIA